MPNRNINRAVLLLHLTVLIWGFTGVLGGLISLEALPLVWYRVVIASISLWLFLKFKRQQYALPLAEMIPILLVGMLVGLHWSLFFYSIKVSTVSVTLVTLSSLTLFTAVLEPLINKKRVSIADIVIGLIIVYGIYLIFKFEYEYFLGIITGILSAVCASLFSIFNARLVKKYKPTYIAYYEMLGACVFVSLLLGFSGQWRDLGQIATTDILYLLLLGVACTSFAYVLGVMVMRELTAFTVALTTNMEPVYGMLLAFVIFGEKEKMSTGFYLGTLIILFAVFMYPVVKNRWLGRKSKPIIRKIH